VVRPPGFEPGTCGLRVRCSAVELEARSRRVDLREIVSVVDAGRRTTARPDYVGDLGVAEGTRTPDFQDHNLAL
jgi:hypothetical protein